MAKKTNYLFALVAVVVAAGAIGYFVLRQQVPAPIVTRTTQTPAAVTTAPSAVVTPPPADCLLPGPAPVPPDGATATAADMQLAHDAIQTFVVELETYQTCRNQQIDGAPPAVTESQKQKWIDQGNAAVDQAHALADAFATQLKIFKARGNQ